MSGFKFHTSSRSDQESIKLLTFQDSYVLHQASSVQSALSTINKEDAIAFPLLRDGVQNNSIDWYSKYSGLQSLESFSAEEQQRIHAQYFNFRQEVFAKFSSSSSLGSLFREILPDGVSNLNEHGEAYFPEIWSNGSDFTLVWGIYRKQDEIILPPSMMEYGQSSPPPIVKKAENQPSVLTSNDDVRKSSLGRGWWMLLICILLLIAIYFLGCFNTISHFTSDISSRRAEAGGQIGNLTVSLIWDTSDDLDLLVVEPDGTTIGPEQVGVESINGGILDVDANFKTITPNPIENIFWTSPPKGKYKIYIRSFLPRETLKGESIKYQIEVINSMSGVEEYNGEIKAFEKGKLVSIPLNIIIE